MASKKPRFFQDPRTSAILKRIVWRLESKRRAFKKLRQGIVSSFVDEMNRAIDTASLVHEDPALVMEARDAFDAFIQGMRERSAQEGLIDKLNVFIAMSDGA